MREWGVLAGHTSETATSLLTFGTRGGQPVVLKAVKNAGDEWRSGEILRAFEGRGAVRVYEHTGGAVLLERLIPGTSLAEIALDGRDGEATDILCEVIARMSPGPPVKGCATLEDWAKSFERYRAGGTSEVPRNLLQEGQRAYVELLGSQTRRRLLHGDLHHDNVLFDAERGWLAIDPKGVVGELEYELGAALRNPWECPELFTRPAVIEHRVNSMASRLKVDAGRVLRWAFAQAVLSAIWCVEDGFAVDENHPMLALADAMWVLQHGM